MRKLVWLLALAACGDDDSGGGGGTPSNTGFVAVSTYNAMSAGMPIAAGGVSVSFNLSTSSSCAHTLVDPCDVYICSAPATPMYASAGTVTIQGLVQPVMLTPMTDKTYTVYSAQQALYAGGETITISAPGADAPAFSLSYTAPSRMSITSPAKPASGAKLTVNRSQGFTASWTGGGAGEVFLYISGPSASNTTISCGFPASSGTGTIPAAALAMVSAGTGSFSVSSLSRKSIDIGDWRIYGQGFFTGVWAADTTMATADVTLQ